MDHPSGVGWSGKPLIITRVSSLPFKSSANRRHHIPKQQYRATSSAAYDVVLRQRHGLTVWFTEEAITAWKAGPQTTRGGQARYSGLAIVMALKLRAVFRLALRQTEDLIGSMIALLGLDLGAGPYDLEPPGRDAAGAPAKAAP